MALRLRKIIAVDCKEFPRPFDLVRNALARRLPGRPQLQVIVPVIDAVSVEVVDVLFGEKTSAEALFHNESMLGLGPSIDLNSLISSSADVSDFPNRGIKRQACIVSPVVGLTKCEMDHGVTTTGDRARSIRVLHRPRKVRPQGLVQRNTPSLSVGVGITETVADRQTITVRRFAGNISRLSERREQGDRTFTGGSIVMRCAVPSGQDLSATFGY